MLKIVEDKMLSDKRRKAIDHYLSGKTKKDAMLAAGYSESMATTRSQDVFHDPDVVAEIERRQKIASNRANISLEWIVNKLKMIAEANVGDALEIHDDGTGSLNLNKLTPELQYAIGKFSTKKTKVGRGANAGEAFENTVQFADKLRALELLVKHLGISKEKLSLEHSGEISLIDRLHAGRKRAGLASEEETE